MVFHSDTTNEMIYMEEAETLFDRIGIMRDGKLLALGKADELKELAGMDKFEDAFVAIVKGAVLAGNMAGIFPHIYWGAMSRIVTLPWNKNMVF